MNFIYLLIDFNCLPEEKSNAQSIYKQRREDKEKLDVCIGGKET